MQNSIELILKQKLGLDANSVGSRIIARAVEQRQTACHLRDLTEYIKLLNSSPEELNQLVEAVVIPETWFFRDRGAFEALRKYAQTRSALKVLSIPCSTGEEPYSIAITLLEAGLSQFQIDAVDISQNALGQAKKAVYRKKSFRGSHFVNLDRYFHQTINGCEVRPEVRKPVNFICGNLLEPDFLAGKQYHVIFCRNLLIYLDESARRQALDALDQVLVPQGLLFLGAVETPQLFDRAYRFVDHPGSFAYQKQDPAHAPSPYPSRGEQEFCRSSSVTGKGLGKKDSAPSTRNQSTTTQLETAQSLADRGELVSAAELCESYVQSYPVQASAYLLLGEIYQGLNQSQQAEKSFRKALYLNPDSYETLIHLALLKEQQGNQEESGRLKKRAQRLIDYQSEGVNR